MKPILDPQAHRMTGVRQNTWRGLIMGFAVLSCASLGGFSLAHAQSTGLGSYQGTIKISGTEIDPEVSYNASIQISLPVTQRDDDSIDAEFYSGEAPAATVSITQWDESHTDTYPGADGHFVNYQCQLAAPKDISMTPNGVLNVDLDQNVHMLSVTLMGNDEIDLNCVHSRTGPYKQKKVIMLYAGTGTPGMQYEHPVPFVDAAHLTATYTLVTDSDQTNAGPIVQEWDLRLAE